MDGQKLEDLKVAANAAAKSAIANYSEVSIVAFSGDSDNSISAYLEFTEDIDEIENFVSGLYADGSTPMYEALAIANVLMTETKSTPSQNQHIILLSDGDANGMSIDTYLNLVNQQNLKQYPHHCIAFDVSESSRAYQELNYISTVSKGRFYNAQGANLGQVFAEATSQLYDLSLGSGTGRDIFTFDVPQHLKPEYVATIEGNLLASNGDAVEAKIVWEDLESQVEVGESRSDPQDGSYFIVLPLGKIYGYYIEGDDLFPVSSSLDLRDSIQEVKLAHDINVVSFEEMIDQGTAVPVNNLFFDFGKAKILRESIPELKRVADIINKHGLNVELSGHTDDIGTDEYNQSLSVERAENVKEFLVKQGCESQLIAVVGYGSSKPLAENTTEAGRQMNRRVEIRFTD